MLLENRNAVIYGGGGAIGSAVARVFAREGARVFIAGRTQARLDGVARDIAATGGMVETAQVDVLDERAVETHASRVAAAGEIDIAPNAVSFMHDQGTVLANLSLDAYMHPIDQFLRSLFITSKAVARHMGKSRPGAILTLTAPAAKCLRTHAVCGGGYGIATRRQGARVKRLAMPYAPVTRGTEGRHGS